MDARCSAALWLALAKVLSSMDAAVTLLVAREAMALKTEAI
jgi:hypothetical protein